MNFAAGDARCEASLLKVDEIHAGRKEGVAVRVDQVPAAVDVFGAEEAGGPKRTLGVAAKGAPGL